MLWIKRLVGAGARAGALPWAALSVGRSICVSGWELGLGSGLITQERWETGHLSLAPVWSRVWQGRVAALFQGGTVSVIANTEDTELAAGWAALVMQPLGWQCKVVAFLGKGGRDRNVLCLLWGSEVLGG